MDSVLPPSDPIAARVKLQRDIFALVQAYEDAHPGYIVEHITAYHAQALGSKARTSAVGCEVRLA